MRRKIGIWYVFQQAATAWVNDKASQLGAALAFYSILSLAPLLVLAIWVASWFLGQNGQDAARSELMGQLESMVGNEGASAIKAMLENANQPAVGTSAGILGLITLLIGASGVFGQLQDSINTIWKIPPPTGVSLWALVRARFLSFAMVLGTGFLLVVSLLLSALVAGVGRYVGGLYPGLEPMLHLANASVTFVMVTILFAMIYRLLPDTNVAWRDVWLGAVVTSALFTVGKSLIGLYLGKSGLGSTYGAAGSLVVLVVWIYYSAQILFFGAELTHVYSSTRTGVP